MLIKKKKKAGRKEQGVVSHEKTKPKPFTVVLEFSVKKNLFIFQLCDRMPQFEVILERRGLKIKY